MFQFRMNDLHKLTSRAHFPNEDHLAASSLAYGTGRGRTGVTRIPRSSDSVAERSLWMRERQQPNAPTRS